MLLTMHRRESFDGGIVRVLRAVKNFLLTHDNLFCFYPYHPNPAVMSALRDAQIGDCPSMSLCEPLAYHDLVYVLTHADLVVTDSGGLQEEAASLAKPVVVVREKTERMEGVWAGLVKLVGTDERVVQQAILACLTREHIECSSPIYGDGYAAQKMVNIIKQQILKRDFSNDGERVVVEKGL